MMIQAIAPDRILVLYSFFSVVVFHGATITQWKTAGMVKYEKMIEPANVSFDEPMCKHVYGFRTEIEFFVLPFLDVSSFIQFTKGKDYILINCKYVCGFFGAIYCRIS